MSNLIDVTQSIFFGTDGFVEIRHNGSVQSRQRWLPVGASPGEYQVRVTSVQNSGGTLTNALTSWTSMSSNRTVTYVNSRQSTDGPGTSTQFVRLNVEFRRTAFPGDSISAEVRLNNNATLQLPVWSGQLKGSMSLAVNEPVTRQVEAPTNQQYAARFRLSCSAASGIALQKEQYYNPGNDGGAATTNVIDVVYINPRTTVVSFNDFEWRMVHTGGTNFANTSHFTSYRSLTDNNQVFYGWLYQTTAPTTAQNTDTGNFRIDVRRISTGEVRNMNVTLTCVNQLLAYSPGVINPPTGVYQVEYFGADFNFAGVGLLVRQEGNFMRVRDWIADSANGPFPSSDGLWNLRASIAWNNQSSPFNYGDYRFRASIISTHESSPGTAFNHVEETYRVTTETPNVNSTVAKHVLTGGSGGSEGQLVVLVEVQQISTGNIVYVQQFELNSFTIN